MVDRAKSDTEKLASTPKPRVREFLGFLPGSGWVWGAAALTVCYLGYAYLLLWPQPVIGPCGPGQVAHFDGCLKPNEIGDLFAGLFAPLAFIWLAVAVLVQAQELQAQREELALTREEMEAQREEMASQRKVWEAQLKETKAQTKALVVEGNERKQSHADRQLDVLLDGIARAVARSSSTLQFQATRPSGSAGAYTKFDFNIAYPSQLRDAGATDDRLLALSMKASQLLDLEQFTDMNHAEPANPPMFELVLTAMNTIEAIRPDITDAANFRLDVIMFATLEKVVRSIAERV